MLFAIVMAAAGLVVLALTVRECVIYLRTRETYPPRRLTLRLSTAGMLLYLLASIYVGIAVFHLGDPVGLDRLWAYFWGCVMLLTLAIFALVIADFRTVQEERSTATRDLWHDMAEIIAAHEAKKREDGQP